MDRILISVIVPVYGAEKYLDKCAGSILSQSYTELELILVDDGSKDLGGQMCDAWAGRDSRVRVLHKENGGLMSAWMAGVQISHGRYLCFVDSDDWIEPEMIEALAAQVRGEVPEIICSNFVIDRGDGQTPQPRSHAATPGEYTGERLLKEIREKILGNENRTVSLSRCMKLFSRELILQNLKYCDPSIRMGEDVNIVLPAMLDCERLVILEGHYDYHYYYNPVSMVHGYDEGLTDNVQRLLRVIRAVLTDKQKRLGSADPEAMQSREAVFLFFLILKNELRSGRKGAAAKAAALCRQEHMPEHLKKYPVTAADPAGRFLLPLMKHPNAFYAEVLAMIFQHRRG